MAGLTSGEDGLDKDANVALCRVAPSHDREAQRLLPMTLLEHHLVQKSHTESHRHRHRHKVTQTHDPSPTPPGAQRVTLGRMSRGKKEVNAS